MMTQYNKTVQCCYRNSRQCIFCRLNLVKMRIRVGKWESRV